jgi:hypothetical protein
MPERSPSYGCHGYGLSHVSTTSPTNSVRRFRHMPRSYASLGSNASALAPRARPSVGSPGPNRGALTPPRLRSPHTLPVSLLLARWPAALGARHRDDGGSPAARATGSYQRRPRPPRMNSSRAMIARMMSTVVSMALCYPNGRSGIRRSPSTPAARSTRRSSRPAAASSSATSLSGSARCGSSSHRSSAATYAARATCKSIDRALTPPEGPPSPGQRARGLIAPVPLSRCGLPKASP